MFSGGAWLAQSVEHASLGSWGREFKSHAGHRDYFFFFFSVFLAVSTFGCLSDVPILLLVFILYLDLEKSWIQSLPVYLYGPCGTFDSSVSILCKCLGVIFLKFKEGHNFSHQKPFQRSDPFSLFHLFSSISVTFRVFC